MMVMLKQLKNSVFRAVKILSDLKYQYMKSINKDSFCWTTLNKTTRVCFVL